MFLAFNYIKFDVIKLQNKRKIIVLIFLKIPKNRKRPFEWSSTLFLSNSWLWFKCKRRTCIRIRCCLRIRPRSTPGWGSWAGGRVSIRTMKVGPRGKRVTPSAPLQLLRWRERTPLRDFLQLAKFQLNFGARASFAAGKSGNLHMNLIVFYTVR